MSSRIPADDFTFDQKKVDYVLLDVNNPFLPANVAFKTLAKASDLHALVSRVFYIKLEQAGAKEEDINAIRRKTSLTVSMAQDPEMFGQVFNVMVVGDSDKDMVQMGKSFGFPRNFPVILIFSGKICVEDDVKYAVFGTAQPQALVVPAVKINTKGMTKAERVARYAEIANAKATIDQDIEKRITELSEAGIVCFDYYYGFRPKFENDERAASTFKYGGVDPSQITSVSIMLKVSGSLISLCFFMYSGQTRWFVVSKNSADADSFYVQEGVRMVAEAMANQLALKQETVVSLTADLLLNEYFDSGFYFCFEMISTRDQCHGARVLRDTLILTLVATRRDAFDKTSGLYMSPNAEPSSRLPALAEHFGFDSTETYVLTENIVATLNALNDARNTMTLSDVETFFKKAGAEMIEGTIKHADFANVLEGLILVIVLENGTATTIKFKYPAYVQRTMGLRSMIQLSNRPKTSKGLENPKYIGTLEAAVTFIESTAEHWSTNEEGRQSIIAWLTIAWSIFMSQPEAVRATPFEHGQVGMHIQIGDLITGEMVQQKRSEMFLTETEATTTEATTTTTTTTSEATTTFEQPSQPLPLVILITGPVARGKTSVAKKLANELLHIYRLSAPIVDGDDGLLDPNNNPVAGRSFEGTGPERGALTMGKVAQMLLLHGICILSCGGGVFCIESLEKIMGCRPGIVHVCVGLEDRYVLYDSTDAPLDDIDRLYTSPESIDAVTNNIHDRYVRGAWAEPPGIPKKGDKSKALMAAAKKIAEAKTSNGKIVKEIASGYGVVGVPAVVYGNESSARAVDAAIEELAKSVIRRLNSPMRPNAVIVHNCHQLRFTAQVTVPQQTPIPGHFTMRYARGNFSLSAQDLETMFEQVGRVVPGFHVQVMCFVSEVTGDVLGAPKNCIYSFFVPSDFSAFTEEQLEQFTADCRVPHVTISCLGVQVPASFTNALALYVLSSTELSAQLNETSAAFVKTIRDAMTDNIFFVNHGTKTLTATAASKTFVFGIVDKPVTGSDAVVRPGANGKTVVPKTFVPQIAVEGAECTICDISTLTHGLPKPIFNKKR